MPEPAAVPPKALLYIYVLRILADRENEIADITGYHPTSELAERVQRLHGVRWALPGLPQHVGEAVKALWQIQAYRVASTADLRGHGLEARATLHRDFTDQVFLMPPLPRLAERERIAAVAPVTVVMRKGAHAAMLEQSPSRSDLAACIFGRPATGTTASS